MHVVGLALFLLAAEPLPSKVADKVTCAQGTRTRLEIRTAPSESQTLVIVGPGDKEVWSRRMSGAYWSCLGFDGQTKRYLIGNRSIAAPQHVSEIAYLSETGDEIPSSASPNLREGFSAFSMLVSPLVRHVAFIGGRHGIVDGLYVLDTQTDEVHRLDAPPAPPPHSCDREFGWACGDDRGLVTVEPSVMRFTDEDTLVVTYGEDTWSARAKARTVKKFTLWPWPYVPDNPPTKVRRLVPPRRSVE